MHCSQCGAQLESGAKFCTTCGASTSGQAPLPWSGPARPATPSYSPPPQQPYPPQGGSGYPGQAQYYGPVSSETIPNYLAGAIIITAMSLVCCCNPISLVLGIVSIVYASQVNSKQQAGDIPGATEASQKAKSWFIASLVVMIALFLLSLALTMMGIIPVPDF